MPRSHLAARQAALIVGLVTVAFFAITAPVQAQQGALAGCDPDGPTPAFLSAANEVFYGCQSMFRSKPPQYFSAIGRFRSAIEKEPSNAVAQFLLGAALAGYDQGDSARVVLARALAMDSGVMERLAPRLAERPELRAKIDVALGRGAAPAATLGSNARTAPRTTPTTTTPATKPTKGVAAPSRPAAAFKTGDIVEIRPSGGDWARGVVAAVEDDRGDGSLYLFQVRHEVVAGDPSTTTTSRVWPQNIRAARGPAPATAATAASSALVYGSYACTYDYWVGAPSARQRKSDPKGALTLRSDGTYRFQSNGGGGRYAYEKATRAIRWLSGPMADMKPERTTFRRNVKTAQVDIRLSGSYEWSCGINL